MSGDASDTGTADSVLVGLDAGGTKLGVTVAALDGTVLLQTTLPAEDWDASDVEVAAEWLLSRARSVADPLGRIAAIGIGAQGCDSVEHCHRLTAAIRRRGLRATVVNDAALLIPAAGVESGIGLIAGTGSIGVGSAADGTILFAGGWGGIIGDESGAAGIVREATRAALLADDFGEPDDGLLVALQRAFDVDSAQHLARAVNDTAVIEHWAPRARAVFDAAESGSVRASSVITAAAEHLVVLVAQLIGRGAVGDTFVVAGGVVTAQPGYAELIRTRLASEYPGWAFLVLAAPPSTGGIELARRLLD